MGRTSCRGQRLQIRYSLESNAYALRVARENRAVQSGEPITNVLPTGENATEAGIETGALLEDSRSNLNLNACFVVLSCNS